MDEGLLLQLTLAEAGLIGLTLLLLVGHGARLLVRARRLREREARAAAAVRGVLVGAEPPAAAREDLERLPLRSRIALFTGLGSHLAGSQRDRLRELAENVALVQRAEAWCCSRRWWRRLRGARLVTLLGTGERTVPDLFDDPRAEVRAQAAEWAAEHPSAANVERLLAMLDDEETLCRFTVKDSLLRIGRPTSEPLRRYLVQHGGARAAEALEVAVGVAGPDLLEPALRLCRDPLPATRARAAALTGAIGGRAAVETLVQLLHDPVAEVRASAAHALGKLEHWPAAASLAALLRDPAWDVRRAAALALRAMGAPGLLLLRRSTSDEDRFASDIARQALDLPGLPRKPTTA